MRKEWYNDSQWRPFDRDSLYAGYILPDNFQTFEDRWFHNHKPDLPGFIQYLRTHK